MPKRHPKKNHDTKYCEMRHSTHSKNIRDGCISEKTCDFYLSCVQNLYFERKKRRSYWQGLPCWTGQRVGVRRRETPKTDAGSRIISSDLKHARWTCGIAASQHLYMLCPIELILPQTVILAPLRHRTFQKWIFAPTHSVTLGAAQRHCSSFRHTMSIWKTPNSVTWRLFS
jgi:hypothetical protein